MSALAEGEWCTSCGDVKACMHYPDAVVTAAYWDAMRGRPARRTAEKTEDEKEADK